MKHILIAGGAGFIGKNITSEIAKNDDTEIYVVDSLITSNEPHFEQKNIIFEKIDICSTEFNDYAYYLPKIDEIWNFACPASPKQYQEYPFVTIDACTIGVKNLLTLALQFTAKFIHSSTSEIYGSTTELMTEQNFGTVNSYGPRSCYDEGKRIAESIIYEYQRKYKKLECYIPRIFNTYGPGLLPDDGRVVSNFIYAALANEPLKIYGSGKKTRSLCYIDDTINRLIELSKSDCHTPVNVGSSVEVTLFDLAELIIKLTESKSIIEYNSDLQDDPQKRRPELDKLNSILSNTNYTSLETGLNSTIEWFRSIK